MRSAPFMPRTSDRYELATCCTSGAWCAAKAASLENALVAKLEWSRLGDSELQRGDVIDLLERAWHRLDCGYIEQWVGQLELRAAWDALRERAVQPPLGG